MDDIKGVWRTVGGRRIFIKDGQDLATAMKESGKFKARKSTFNETVKTNSSYMKEVEVNNSNEIFEEYDEYTQEIIKDVENSKIGLKHEKGAIITRNGTLLEEIGGVEHSIELSDKQKSYCKNAIFTHNHPLGGNFSSEDIYSYLELDLYEIRASTDSGTCYSLKKGKGKVDSISFAKAFIEANPKGYSNSLQRLQNDIKSGIINPQSLPYNEKGMYAIIKAGDRNMDDWLNKNAEEYGFIYTKED